MGICLFFHRRSPERTSCQSWWSLRLGCCLQRICTSSSKKAGRLTLQTIGKALLLIADPLIWLKLTGLSNVLPSNLVLPRSALYSMTTFEPVLRVQKLGNGPQEGPEDREEAWGRLGAQTWRKWATWTSRRESCLSFSVLSSTCKRRASQGQGSLQQYKSAKSNNQL